MVHGRFTDVSHAPNMTVAFLIDAANAGLVVVGEDNLCNLTTVVQEVDGLSKETCPPNEGGAWMFTNT